MKNNFDKIICAGKNYLDHAHEMQEDIPEKPVIFLKPPSILKICPKWQSTLQLVLPKTDHSEDVHYECELVFRISRPGYKITIEEAKRSVSHATLGLDMTHRALQKKAKDAGGPWTFGKVFPDAAAIGPWVALEDIDLKTLDFKFLINGEIKQKAQANDMRMNPYELLSYVSQYMPICEGDILFTGTPKGVGPAHPGDNGQLFFDTHYYNISFV